MAIFFHDEDIQSGLKEKRKIKSWISEVVSAEGCQTGEINIVFTSDSYLIEVNKKYLSRDYLTDIITFDYREGAIINGDLLISVERVRENAEQFSTGFNNELNRVIIHGILHLIGYKDSEKEEMQKMREKEEKYLKLLKRD